VDSPEKAADFDAAYREGPVFVTYGPSALEVVHDCKTKGAYTFTGTPPDMQKKVFLSLSAELPFRGKQLETATEAERARGGVVALLTTTSGSFVLDQVPTRATLGSACKAATHVVTSLLVGAFELGVDLTHAKPELDGMFRATPGPPPTSFRKLAYEGTHSACFRADMKAPTPPRQCDYLVRVALAPLDI